MPSRRSSPPPRVRYPATTTRKTSRRGPSRRFARRRDARGADAAVRRRRDSSRAGAKGRVCHDAADAADADRRAADVAAVLAGAEETVQAIVVADDVDEAERAERRRRKEERRKARATKRSNAEKSKRRGERRGERRRRRRRGRRRSPTREREERTRTRRRCASEMDPSAMGFSEGGTRWRREHTRRATRRKRRERVRNSPREETGAGATIAADTEPSGGIYTPSMVPSPSPSPAPPASETTATPAAAETTTTPAVAPGSDGDDDAPAPTETTAIPAVAPAPTGTTATPAVAVAAPQVGEKRARSPPAVPPPYLPADTVAAVTPMGGTTGEEAAVDVFVRTEEGAGGGAGGGSGGGGGTRAGEEREKGEEGEEGEEGEKGEEGEEGEGGVGLERLALKGYLSHSKEKSTWWSLSVVAAPLARPRPLLSTRPSGMSRRRRRAFAALFAALCVSRVVLVCGSADDASASRTAPADARRTHLSSRLRDIAADVEANADYVIRLRRELHLVPELMWTEVKTSAIVKRELDAMGIAHAHLSPPGVLATIGTGAPPVVLLRADMDALPITEASDIPPRATQRPPGKDARLRPRRPRRHAPRRRPRSSNPASPPSRAPSISPSNPPRRAARARDACSRNASPTRDHPSTHPSPCTTGPTRRPASGVVATRPGVIMAGSAAFEIVVVGVGGHAAKPAELVDVVACVAAIVTASQTIIFSTSGPAGRRPRDHHGRGRR